jgi:hypothetical protein
MGFLKRIFGKSDDESDKKIEKDVGLFTCTTTPGTIPLTEMPQLSMHYSG